SGKNNNPDISASIAGMGDLQYKYIVMPYTDEPNLNLLRTELQERWGPVNQADGFAVTVLSGTYGDISTFGVSRNDHLISCMGIAGAPEPSYLYAATLCAVASQALSIDPARPLQTLTLPGRMPPAVGDRFTWSERNALLFDGISTFNVNDGGEMQIERMITMYRTNKYGDSDPSYLNVNTIATLSYLRYSLRTRITQKFPNYKLASDGTRFATGQAVVTPSVIKTELLALFEEWESAGLVEDFDTFKEELYVARNKDDKDRLDVLCGPNLINQFRIFAAQVQFIL
ncbi:TPA: phage tail protein, partial [Escherichia coli]|nr:phage tail protein [Escherichia coli]HAI0726163.1 phage tail protein [Escherichia coli]